MCFVGNLENLKIAQEPILCIKWMELDYINGKWRLNSQNYPSENGYAIGDEISPSYLTDEGFAEFVNRTKIGWERDDAPIVLEGEVVHSYTCESDISDEQLAKSLTDLIVGYPCPIKVACEIPKGTPYITNGYEYASRKLIIKGVVLEPVDGD